MKIQVFPVNELLVNCYLLWDETSFEAALIDCGAQSPAEWAEIKEQIIERQLTLKYVLLTHCHFDHIMGLAYIHRDFGKAPIFHHFDQQVYDKMPQMATQFGIALPLPLPQAESHLKGGEELPLGESTLKVLHTPGHTWGGVCFYAPKEQFVISGDTLFRGSLGRTDLGGDMDEEIHSIRTKLLTLPPETNVYPGHGPASTIGWEQQNNPYVRSY